MTDTLERLTSVGFVVAALAFAGVIVHREFYTNAASPPMLRAGEYMSDWKSLVDAGRTIGNPQAPIQLVEFADLQCPFCARFNDAVRALHRAYPSQVRYVFVHLPLSIHPFARTAAHAAECAGNAGRFPEMLDAMYARQDSFGLKPWVSYADDAGIPDTSAFAQCLTQNMTQAIVDSGVSLSRRLGIFVTPTVVLNGWRYGSPPSDTELVRAAGDILARRRPYAGYPSLR